MSADLPQTMKCIIFPEPNQVALVDQPTPQPEPGTIVCRTQYSGLSNGTERNQLTGGNYGRQHPNGIGYQKVAQVVAIGDEVTDYSIGDTIISYTVGKHSEFFREDVSNPDAPRCLVTHLPEGIDPTHAALLGVGGVAAHDVRRIGVKLGDRVLVVGAGLIGQFTAQVARAAGGEITMVNRSGERLAAAREAGITRTATVADDQQWQAVRDTGPFDAVFETTGADVLDQVVGRIGQNLGVVARHGRLALIGGRFDVRFDCNPAQFAGIEMVFAAHFERTDLMNLLRLVREGLVNVAPLLREIVPIAQAESVYHRLRDEPASLFGAVFDWT